MNCPFKSGLIVLYLAAFSALSYFAIAGYSYYRTPLEERPRHEDFWELKPGGSTGHALGVAGSSLLVVMLVYSVRKRMRRFRAVGQLKSWLQFHIFCGIVGPLLVILHSSFKVQGLVALSFWSMIIVAASGFVGRYLYQQVPRRRSGDELTLSETQELSAGLGSRLVEEFALEPAQLEEVEEIATGDLDHSRGLLATFVTLPWHGLVIRWRLRRIFRRFGSLPGGALRDLRRTLARKAILERRIRMWGELQRLFYFWHLFHKPFAVIMYLFMALHIGVAIATGYGGF